MSQPLLGARLDARGASFGLFATGSERCRVRLFDSTGVLAAEHPLEAVGDGFFQAQIAGVGPGALYKFVVGDRELPDPYARFLPLGVHGPALLDESTYAWKHGPGTARPLGEQVIYELHVGTFSEAGTYDGVRARLPALADLGITALELLPLAAFPGTRGWGYDGVALYAPFAPYGTPDQLRALVDEAHRLNLSVFLDVVYNHFGPSGNYLAAYSPLYFSDELRNAWGAAPNYRHPVMRRLVLENARYWLTEFHFDGLRLDATHAIVDPSPRHILSEMADDVARLSPPKLLVAEDENNDPRWIQDAGLHALWADDFHHAVRVTVTGENDGYYRAYEPGAKTVACTIERGWLYEGQPYPVTGKSRGAPAGALDAHAFVYCIQNHDQVGNRALGDRLSAAVSADQYRALSTLLLFLPMTPLLFMGQEWAASTPFQYFTDHEPELGAAIARGRRQEFKHFTMFADEQAAAQIPDPQDVATFQRSRLRWDERTEGEHARTLALYRRLLQLRRTDPVLRAASRAGLSATAIGDVLLVERATAAGGRSLLLNFGKEPVDLRGLHPCTQEATLVVRSDGAEELGGVLPPATAVVLGRNG